MLRDYSGQNLRGKSFQGQNLEGANFSQADIRGANFTGANLKGANFSHAQAGLQKRWATFLVLVCCLICGLAGFLSAFVGALISSIFDNSNLSTQVLGWTTLILVIIVFIVIINHQRLNSARSVAEGLVILFAGALACFAIAGKSSAANIAEMRLDQTYDEQPQINTVSHQ